MSFRSRAIRWQALAGLLAQVSQGAAGAGIILVIREHRGSLALAGVVVAALWISAGVARPIQGRLIDRRGPAGVLAGCGLVHGAALAAIVIVAPAHPLGVVFVALGVAGGLALPPVSTTMRVAWGRAAGDGERTAAYSLVYLVQELALLTGPLILAGLVGAFSAPVALVAIGALAAGGSLAFAIAVDLPRLGEPGEASAEGPVLRLTAIRLLLAIAVLTGAIVGGIQVAAPTIAAEHHSPAAAGLLIAAVSVGGVIGALIYARGRWRSRPASRLLLLFGSVAVMLGLASAAGALVLVGVLLVLVGLPLNPAISTLSLVVDEHVPRRAAGQAFGWLSTAIAAGSGAGSVVAAALAQEARSGRAALLVTVVAAGGACAVSVAGRRVLGTSGTRPDPRAGPPGVRAAVLESRDRPPRAGGRSPA